MTVCAIGVVRGTPRTKILGNTPWGTVSHSRSCQLLVGWDDESNRMVVIPFTDQFSPDDFPVVSMEQLEEMDIEQFDALPSSVRKSGKCTRQQVTIDEVWTARGATLVPVTKPDSSFLRGKAPSKMGRKKIAKRRS